MKPIDITKQILAMHEDEVMNNMLEEVKNELKGTIPSDIQTTLDACMQKLSNEGNVTPSNVVSFKPKSTPSIISFAETELLAASGQSLGDWFSQPMNFGGAGFILDVRKVIGSDNEVDLYLNPNQVHQKISATQRLCVHFLHQVSKKYLCLSASIFSLFPKQDPRIHHPFFVHRFFDALQYPFKRFTLLLFVIRSMVFPHCMMMCNCTTKINNCL